MKSIDQQIILFNLIYNLLTSLISAYLGKLSGLDTLVGRKLEVKDDIVMTWQSALAARCIMGICLELIYALFK